MDEQSKQLVELMFNGFLDAIHELGENTEKAKAEIENIKYGLDLLKKGTDDRQAYSTYSMMWAAYYYGVDFGIDITKTIMAE